MQGIGNRAGGDGVEATLAGNGKGSGDAENIAVLVDFLMAKLSLTREDATLLHIEMWAYVLGIAVLCASG